VRFLLDLIALALLTALCFWLDFRLVEAAFTYLILIVLLSLSGGFISLIALSFIAVGCLNFFFAPPIFEFRVDSPEDIIAVAAFLITSLVITSLVAKMTAGRNALRDSDEKWRAVFEHNPTMYFLLDEAGTVMSVNPHGADTLGYSVGELVGRAVMDLFHEADRPAVQRNASLCLERLGQPTSWEARKHRKDGTIMWVRETAKGMLIKQQPVLLVVCEDITDRKRAEYLAEHVFETIPDIASIIGRDYRYRRVNPAHERFWRMSGKEIIGRHARDIIGGEPFEQLAKPHLDRCFAGEEVSFSEWIDSPIGRRYWVASYSPLRLETDRVESALVLAHDLTDHMLASERLRDAQAELAHANRVATIGQLTASIAHEVNQPIGALVANAYAALNWLKTEPPDLAEGRRSLDEIIKDGRRASDVIERTRALIKKTPTQIDVLDINGVVMETLALTRGEILRNRVSVERDLASDLPSIRGDRVQLQQVIMNLVMNALEAMSNVDEGSRELQIVTGKDGDDQIFVRVRDSGPTLKPEALDRFFEAFYSTKSSGMGIGLSICRSIIDAHGGRIWATENSPHGAILHIILPISGGRDSMRRSA
jgi:PAS domain S-box-containing protein